MKTYRYEVSFVVEVEAENIIIAEQAVTGEGISVRADPLHALRTPSVQQAYRSYDWLRIQPSYARLKIVGHSHRRL